MDWRTDILTEPHTIAWDYLSSFSMLHEALSGIHDFILSYPKDGLVKILDGVWASPEASIAPTACIKPPCIIGRGAEIRHCAYIRGDAVIGDGVVIGNSCEIKNAIISDSAEIPHFNLNLQESPPSKQSERWRRMEKGRLSMIWLRHEEMA